MALTVKTFLDKDSRDREYYAIAKTHFDVMRYGDQDGNHMVWCIAHGSRVKEAVPQRADTGIELGVVEGPIEGAVGVSEDAIFNGE